jgi:betaine-aldehyde dehydrogenase
MTDSVLNFVDGKSRPAASGRTSDLVDPSTGEVYAMAALSDERDVAAATAAAAAAF